MSTALILIVAMVLDAVMGEPKWLWDRAPHPAVLMGRAIAWCEQRFNSGTQKRLNGILTITGLCGLAYVVGHMLGFLGPVVEIIVAAILIAQRSLIEHVRAVATCLRTSTDAGRHAVSMIVSRDTSALAPSDVARAAIESGSENLSDGVIAPAFWFLLLGLPGLLIYKMANTADSMIGYRTPRYAEFGWAAARFDDLLNLFPARLTAILIALPTGRISQLSAIQADAALHKSPNAGWPEAAMSRAIGAALAGPRTYDGQMQDFAWVNAEGRKDLTPEDIDQTIQVMWRAWTVMLGVVAVLAVL